jgi:hypothetical protein
MIGDCIGTQCGVFTVSEGVFTPVTIPNGVLTFGATISPTGAIVICIPAGRAVHLSIRTREQRG